MKRLLNKELRLAASPLTWIFLAFAAMTMLPGYPILVGAMFVCLGIFYSFQSAREANDILYTVLLPIRKRDVVKAKYLFCCCFEGMAFVLMAALTVVRMTALRDAAAYVNNVMMNATPLYLGFVLCIFGAFNGIFLGGFFRTAYAFGGPFVRFLIAGFLLVALGETLHHLPGLAFLNGGGGLGAQLAALVVGAAIFALWTGLSYRRAAARFETLDF